ncbi:extracellular solute-binding protein [Streptomyces sp. H10-C2]|uniref:ABC transporter substrate-binding protein n=1 Tax=unclassified Streptomyces TaxID=2593676 RepID=UPI0024B87B07|nr:MULTISPECIES: extracellular solute-binding protein [unclassified Streptomyces]MDJ0340969.1 extracellular solute-binding protein [Streptomyces sp. PH10-H1]MDJ0369799.1 extracellular solute-binding protein [Streptomyces sp. H10-C2]
MKRIATTTAAVLSLALAATACSGGQNTTDSAGGTQELKGQTVTVAAVWTGVEQANFKKVLDAFSAKTGAKTTFVSTGDNVSTIIGSKIEGGNAPDVVMVPQLGVLQQFARKGWLSPLSPQIGTTVATNFAKAWKNYGTVDGTFYGLYFKGSNKSTVWYSPQALKDAGVTIPTSFEEMLTAAGSVSDSGLPAFAVAGEAGWPLTDWFENLYLSQAGPTHYDELAQHKIPWTDPTVVKALTTLGRLFSNDRLMSGGRSGALQTDFPESVNQVFGKTPKAGMVYEGDFVSGLISGSLHKKVGQDAKFFPFPAVTGGVKPVVGGGDAAVALKAGKNPKAAMKLIEFLAGPEAAGIWAKEGGYLSPNRKLDTSAYPDDTTRQTAQSLVDAGDTVRFDMSDQAPAAFGGTQGSGEWKILQDFLRDPSTPLKTAQALETAAAKAYKS